ncbi:HAD hydrolase family protein [Erythrobacter sp. SN021]|uniref:HAD hydrolase family protein n=1 Tax=Erythrobacter sp. SN021 TaxID=2912574 RepID=UPI001F2AA37C|nr:HAD hydrolase family protein [Erythrobacter sp. SN021]MCF8882737.1 HAD hydrolase family protein [Erythrobacter sp. SN021]
MTRFGEKLDVLLSTVELVRNANLDALVSALADNRGRGAVAVGSGGSMIAAQFFARCRETLSGDRTEVVTPAELVLANRSLEGEDVWLFSAGADNADSVAAVLAARSRNAAAVNVVTRNASGAAALSMAEKPNSRLVVLPVADSKDSFLATHSLVSAVVALVLAANRVSEDPLEEGPGDQLISGLEEIVRDPFRAAMAERFSELRPDDLLLLISDPQVRSVADLIETSVWEAAICAVQRTDIRNFAHGRHTWLHHRAEKTFVLALTGHDTSRMWDMVASNLPASVRIQHLDFGDGGRLRNAIGIVEGLLIIEAMGKAVGIDPGKPGVGEFGRNLYDNDGLLVLADRLGPSIRQKRAAVFARDDLAACHQPLCLTQDERQSQLTNAIIGGIVLDYDGTLVSDSERYGLPRQALIDEMVRLDALDVRLAIATGRGGSAGAALREALPTALHRRLMIGYYNGAYIQPLEVDIDQARPAVDAALAETFAWLEQQPHLFSGPFEGRFSDVQISVKLENLVDQDAFTTDVQDCPAIASGTVRFAASGHSIDFFGAGTSKRNVVRQVQESLANRNEVLCVGDSGARSGNDNELLSCELGISVGTVCGRHDGCWALFGTQLTGPEALLKLLQALQGAADGSVRIDVNSLYLDRLA